MRFCDTRLIKFDEKTLESLSESDDDITIPRLAQRRPIRPANPRPKKPKKNYEPAKPTRRQLALMAKHENENLPLSNNNEEPPLSQVEEHAIHSVLVCCLNLWKLPKMIRKITVWIMQQTKKTLRMEISSLQLKIQAESMAGKIRDLPGKLACPEV